MDSQDDNDNEEIEWDVEEAGQNFTFKGIEDQEKKQIIGALHKPNAFSPIEISKTPSEPSIDASKVITLEELEGGLGQGSHEAEAKEKTKYSDLDVEFERKLKLAKEKEEELKLLSTEEEDFFSITDLVEEKPAVKGSKSSGKTPQKPSSPNSQVILGKETSIKTTLHSENIHPPEKAKQAHQTAQGGYKPQQFSSPVQQQVNQFSTPHLAYDPAIQIPQQPVYQMQVPPTPIPVYSISPNPFEFPPGQMTYIWYYKDPKGFS